MTLPASGNYVVDFCVSRSDWAFLDVQENIITFEVAKHDSYLSKWALAIFGIILAGVSSLVTWLITWLIMRQ